MMLLRAKPASSEGSRKPTRKDIPTLEEFLKNRDYTGALTLLEFNKENDTSLKTDLWMAYCSFHMYDYKKASEIYKNLAKNDPVPVDVLANLAICYFYLGMYPEAEKTVNEAPASPCKSRLQMHLALKMKNDKTFAEHKRALEISVEDRLSLASIHYLQNNYEEAINIYKNILTNNRDFVALNVYQALCLYKQEFYDAAEEMLQVYLQQNSDSPTALNLKACNSFRVYDTNAVQANVKQLLEKVSSSNYDLIQHNNVVFRGGDGALQVLPNLVDLIPEARCNLAIYYLHHDETNEAFELMKDVEPKDHQEYILKAIIHAIIGQEKNSIENRKTAKEYFQYVGTSEDQVDTIPGRQCMASFFFLDQDFDKVLLYLQTIRSYFSKEDIFNFNYGQTQIALKHFKEAEEAFKLIQSERFKSDYTFVTMLAYCYIMNGKGQLAWDLYLKLDSLAGSMNLLQMIGDVCYKLEDFWHAAKAFDVLERMDPKPEYWEGLRGACCGTFQYIVTKKLPRELLPEVVELLKNRNSQAEQIVRVMRKYGKEKRIAC